jgi:hypothetical protein
MIWELWFIASGLSFSSWWWRWWRNRQIQNKPISWHVVIRPCQKHYHHRQEINVTNLGPEDDDLETIRSQRYKMIQEWRNCPELLASYYQTWQVNCVDVLLCEPSGWIWDEFHLVREDKIQ